VEDLKQGVASERPVILITDDLFANRLALKKILKHVDADLIEADSGNQALSLALVTPNLALILMDVQMPGMTGFEAVEFLQEEATTQHVPVIFITAAHRDEQNSLLGYAAGAVDYIYKPVNTEILLSKVRVFLEMWTLQSVLQSKLNELESAHKVINELSQRDSLTGLPNRRFLFENIPSELARLGHSNKKMAVIFIDLDGFKNVNDTFGHEAGDALLRIAGGRFLSIVRPLDIVARLGGDEYVIILKDIAGDECIIPKLKEAVTQMSTPFVLAGHSVTIGCSIGVAIYPTHGSDFDTLMNRSDEAMYEAKKAGKNTFRIYCDSMDKQGVRRREIVEQINYALQREEFSLNFQAIVDVATGIIVGAEALLRWNNELLGFVGPDEFIPLAEATGHMNNIGSWVLGFAVSTMNSVNKACNAQLNLAVNVSPIQFQHADLYEQVAAFNKSSLTLNLLELEITEGLLMDDSEGLKQKLFSLVGSGVCLSIDDFGTGYSSLSYLKRYPVDTVKIDRAFVMGLPGDEDDAVLVKAIIAMAHGLGKKVIAEGVETEAQWRFLQDLGCDLAQGYYFSKPLPEEEFMHYVKEQLEVS